MRASTVPHSTHQATHATHGEPEVKAILAKTNILHSLDIHAVLQERERFDDFLSNCPIRRLSYMPRKLLCQNKASISVPFKDATQLVRPIYAECLIYNHCKFLVPRKVHVSDQVLSSPWPTLSSQREFFVFHHVDVLTTLLFQSTRDEERSIARQ